MQLAESGLSSRAYIFRSQRREPTLFLRLHTQLQIRCAVPYDREHTHCRCSPEMLALRYPIPWSSITQFSTIELRVLLEVVPESQHDIGAPDCSEFGVKYTRSYRLTALIIFRAECINLITLQTICNFAVVIDHHI